jgi:hypothetical protein
MVSRKNAVSFSSPICVGRIVPSVIRESSAKSRSRHNTQSIVSPLWSFLPFCRAAILMALAVSGCVGLSAQQASLASPTPVAASLPDAPSSQKASQTAQETQDALHPQASNESGGASPSSTAPNGSKNVLDDAKDAANQSNNPITLKVQIVLESFFAPKPEGDRGRSTDEVLARLYVPFKVFGVDNLVRIYQPIFTDPLFPSTDPPFPSGREAGLGDTTIYDLALHEMKKVTVGAGPLFVFPVANHTNEGDGKWQAGGAVVAVTSGSWGVLGSVVTYQHSFTGDGSPRPSAQMVTVQPKAYYNLRHGLYLRSSGIWYLNIDAPHVSEIPIGFGMGKAMKLQNGTIMNFFVEPQYSVYQHGDGAPKWQILTGFNILFPNKQESKH